MVGGTVFVTVGTTQFDALVQAAVSAEVCCVLRDKGYTSLRLQIGQGQFVPSQEQVEGLRISHFRLKSSIAPELAEADLVVSHAGAGSCTEALGAGKPLVAVVNQALMDNHQLELAEELANCGYCAFCYPDNLGQTLAELDVAALKPYLPGRPQRLAQHLDSVVQLLP